MPAAGGFGRYTCGYASPLGPMLLAADDAGLTGLWFEGQKYFARGLAAGCKRRAAPALTQAVRWLDVYFAGKEPDFSVPLHFNGTAFQNAVWELLCAIPYGRTVTYGRLAERLATEKGLEHMSAQAVGGAVGRNAISIIVPCHRVIGADGSLTGYAGGTDKQLRLLQLERAEGFLQYRIPPQANCGGIFYF